MKHPLSGKVFAFIRRQRVARVATVGPDGSPHSVAVCTATANGAIYFASAKGARKVQHIRRHPRVALEFDTYSENWKRLAGVTIAGTATVVERGAAFQRARRALYRKYKQYARVEPIEPGETVIVCVTPNRTFSWGL